MPTPRALPPRIVRLLAVLALALPRAADAQAAPVPDTARVRIVSIPGSLPEPRNAVVVLPSGYHRSARRYPVLYLLHGHDGGHRNWMERTNLLAYTARLPLVVVLPDAGNSWYTNSFARPEERFEDYVGRDVPAYVDQHFRTLTFREARYVAGLSMGGYGALKLALKNPGRFSLAGSFSGALTPVRDTSYQSARDAFGPLGSAARAENDLLALAREARVPGDTHFYFDMGSADRWISSNRELAEVMAARPLAYEYHEVPGAHGWEFWNRRLPVFLALVEERIARLPAAETRSRTGREPSAEFGAVDFGGGVRQRVRQTGAVDSGGGFRCGGIEAAELAGWATPVRRDRGAPARRATEVAARTTGSLAGERRRGGWGGAREASIAFVPRR